MPIPRSLQDKLRSRRIIPFVGAGVSMSVRERNTQQPLFPSWKQLLNSAAERLEQETKTADASLIRSLLNVQPPDFLEAARRARRALGAVWYDFLKEKLEINSERIDPQSLELARRMWRLGSKLIVTTNYDDVLKWACPWPDDLQTWDIEAAVEQASLLQQKLQRPVIWHLHGRIANASQMILTPDGYELLYSETDQGQQKARHEAALNTLRHQIVSKSLLFTGFSLDDEHFGLQLKRVHEIYKGAVGPHYAIVLDEQAERVRGLDSSIEPLTVSDFGNALFSLMGELETFVPAEGETSESQIVIPNYGPHLPVFYVPFKQKGDEIVGQQDVLEDVRKQLAEGKRTAIGQTAAFRGLGGLGKTQLAIEYAYRYRDEYPNGVIWLTADQNIDAQLVEIAERARWIAPESEHKYKIQIAQQRIRSYSDCLIIFDNLEDRRAIDPYLPEPEANPHILVTSRSDHADFYPVPLRLLDEKLSRQLLLKEARRDPKTEEEGRAVDGIVALLGGLPLALELAGAYLGHRRAVRFQQYYELLSKDLKNALPKNVSSFTKHEADLYGTLHLSEGLLQQEQHLRDVLDLLTWSGSAPMSTALISYLLDVPNDGALAVGLALGAELRLLQQSKEEDSYSLHRLVGEVRRTEIPLEQRLEWADAVCSRIGDWFQDKREDFSELTGFESNIDHLKKWQQNAARYLPSHSSRLMWLQAYPAHHRGKYIEARHYLIEAQIIFEQIDDQNKELKANLLSDLAYTNYQLGNVRTVLSNYKDALSIRRDLFGEKHRDIARSLAGIGSWYGEQGDLQRALKYLERALAMERKLFGEHHSVMATLLANIGILYGEQGDLQREFAFLQQALTMRRELFGERHPDIASSLSSIGSWYGEQGDLKRALEYSHQALTMRLQLYGERHPEIAASLANLGDWYVEQGELQRALEYCEQALSMQRELLGERHPDIATTLKSLGKCYGRRGDPQRALEYTEQALTMNREFFGERHPAIAISLNDVGNWYSEQGDFQRALQYLEQALNMHRDMFGERHREIATTLSNMSRLYGQQGDFDRAFDYSEQALTMRRELFGQRHPRIAASLSYLGILYGQKGDDTRALEYWRQCLAMYQELFGDRYHLTVEAAIQLAAMLAKLNRRKEAYNLVRHFVGLATGSYKERLVSFEARLRSNLPGFRPYKANKRKGRKKRR